MLDLNTLKPDYEGSIGKSNWSFKLFIFQQADFLKKGYFRGLIQHQAEDGQTQPVEGIISEDSLVIFEKEFYDCFKAKSSITYEFSFMKNKKLELGSRISGKQTKLAKFAEGGFYKNFTRKAIIWKC